VCLQGRAQSPTRLSTWPMIRHLVLLYWLCFILAPEVAVLGNVFAYWAATHSYLIRESSQPGPSSAREGEGTPRSRGGDPQKT